MNTDCNLYEYATTDTSRIREMMEKYCPVVLFLTYPETCISHVDQENANCTLPKELYIVPVINGDHLFINGCSRAMRYKLCGVTVGCGLTMSFDEFDKLIPLITNIKVGLGESYYTCSDDMLAELGFTKKCIGTDMRKVVSLLDRLGKVKVRYTEHEYRADCRDLIWIQDYPSQCSVEELLSNPDSDINRHLLSLAGL
jgi:hypothetical protein